MKKFSIFILLVFSINILFSQERQNRNNILIKDSSKELKSATGWIFRETTGKWVSNHNLIDVAYAFDYCAKSNYRVFQSHQEQNFVQLQTKSFMCDSVLYYVLIVHSLDGWYDYPSIMEGWHVKNIITYSVFSEEEYKKLYSVNGTIQLCGQSIQTNDVSENINDLLYECLNNDHSYRVCDCIWMIRRSDEGKIRFLLPYHSYYCKPNNLKFDFENLYFETSLESFDSIIISDSTSSTTH